MSKIKPSLGVCYYPEHWPEDMWADDARRMVECGIQYVRIAEFAWSRFEPSRGQFTFDWLDRAIQTLGEVGLKIIMCTPTATPPKWLVDEMPDMVAVDKDGNPRKWGSRRHYDFSHQGYRAESTRITTIMAKRFGDNSHVVAWQTDNEYGCHDTTLSYSTAARDGFRDWLAQKYQSPDALNTAWGNVFWSMEVRDFNEVELPNLTVTEANPAHVLDFRRYASDQVAAFNKTQTDILRKLSPGRDLIHNFMGNYLEFDHFDVSKDLDIASWDSYPIGMLERDFDDDIHKLMYGSAGDPDTQALHHDLYRACTPAKRMWIMEQQPGPVNWAPWNPDPNPGMVRLWSHEAFAHGAEVVSYFRWRQAPFAQEQFHAGLIRPDNSKDRGFIEAEQVGRELALLPEVETEQAKVALLFDYESLWANEIQPQGQDYNGFELLRDFYSSLRFLGQSIDIVSRHDDYNGYALIVVPHLFTMSEATLARLEESGAQVLFGPRTASRTQDHSIPENLAPGILQRVLPMRVTRVSSMRHGMYVGMYEPNANEEAESVGEFERWMEIIEPGEGAEVLLQSSTGSPGLLHKSRFTYMAGWPNTVLRETVLASLLRDLNLPVVETGDDLRLRDKGRLRTIVNYGQEPQDASHLIEETDRILIGNTMLEVAGVLVVERA